VEVIYSPFKTTAEKILRVFFETHDPTQEGRQGPDVGERYSSVIFYKDEEQKETALKLIGLLEKKGLNVVTKLLKADKFWPGEDYHQDYYEKKGAVPYCHARKTLF
jgi:peptide methionine sulfoxide reductase msrA/msrB